MTTRTMNVLAISCGHCERTVKGALELLPGVCAVDVDIAGRKVTVDYDESVLSLETIEATLADEDYPVASAG